MYVNQCHSSFFTGQRSCLGESIAIMELFLFLLLSFTSLVQCYTIFIKDFLSLPSLKAIFGLTYSPKPYQLVTSKWDWQYFAKNKKQSRKNYWFRGVIKIKIIVLLIITATNNIVNKCYIQQYYFISIISIYGRYMDEKITITISMWFNALARTNKC